MLNSADDDFTLGILGPWGRGKTYLAEQVATELHKSDYVTISFSAWAYPDRPHLWAHLYERVLQASRFNKIGATNDRIVGFWARLVAFATAIWNGIPRILATHARAARFNLYQRGPGTLIVATFTLAVILLPLSFYLKVGHQLYVLLGIAGLFMLWKLYGGYKVIYPELTRLLRIKRHHQHLGLQAAIGTDLKDLLRAWMPTESDAKELWHGFKFLYCVAWLAVAASLCYGFNNNYWSLAILLPIAGFLAVGFFVMSRYVGIKARPKRALLIVDDLDRCLPSQTLEIIESLRQFIETSSVASRLQVMFLAEEMALVSAILQKYGGLASVSSNDTVPTRTTQIINETMEKLFVAFLRLPELNETEIHEAIHEYVALINGTSDRSTWDYPTPEKPEDPTLFWMEETYALELNARSMVHSRLTRPSIRSAHNLVRRYQIARAILHNLNDRIDSPHQFVARLTGSDIALVGNTEEAVAKQLMLYQTSPSSLRIVKAVYGDIAMNEVRDCTSILAAATTGMRLQFPVNNSTLDGDPLPGRRKALKVDYVVDEEPRTQVVMEGELLVI